MVTWPFSSTKRVAETVDQFGGLCLRCHPQSSIRQTTGGAWKSLDRVHNTVKGWGGSGANANNAVHSYTCSKCHAPHNSALNRLMVTNCLDYNHRGQRVSGGTASQATVTDKEGRGNGRFPAGGGGRGTEGSYAYFFGSTAGGRACHDNTNATAWPSNQLWNTKTVW